MHQLLTQSLKAQKVLTCIIAEQLQENNYSLDDKDENSSTSSVVICMHTYMDRLLCMHVVSL